MRKESSCRQLSGPNVSLPNGGYHARRSTYFCRACCFACFRHPQSNGRPPDHRKQVRSTDDGGGRRIERWVWPVSTGRLNHDTAGGTFNAIWTDADHVSREWDNAPMPYSIFFTQSGHAIHGTLNTQRLGSAASHRCVRLAPQNAKKLYSLAREYGLAKREVVLTGDVKLSLSAHTQPVARMRASGNKSVAEVFSLDQEISAHPMRSAISQTFGDFQPDISYDHFR
jgi:L,D-transpeptidase catalytic domain